MRIHLKQHRLLHLNSARKGAFLIYGKDIASLEECHNTKHLFFDLFLFLLGRLQIPYSFFQKKIKIRFSVSIVSAAEQ